MDGAILERKAAAVVRASPLRSESSREERRPQDVYSLSAALSCDLDISQRGAFSLDEFADWSGICKTLVRQKIKEGRLIARQITRRRVVILARDAQDFMNSLPKVNMAEAA